MPQQVNNIAAELLILEVHHTVSKEIFDKLLYDTQVYGKITNFKLE